MSAASTGPVQSAACRPMRPSFIHDTSSTMIPTSTRRRSAIGTSSFSNQIPALNVAAVSRRPYPKRSSSARPGSPRSAASRGGHRAQLPRTHVAEHPRTGRQQTPGLLDQWLRLIETGIGIEVSEMICDLLRRRPAQAVDHTVTLLVERAASGCAAIGCRKSCGLENQIAVIRPCRSGTSGSTVTPALMPAVTPTVMPTVMPTRADDAQRARSPRSAPDIHRPVRRRRAGHR